MRKLLIIALSLLSYGVLSGTQNSASAAANCQEVCLKRQQIPGEYPRCVSSKQVCTGAHGAGPGGPIQQQKLKRQR
jgi:hypothetical protein